MSHPSHTRNSKRPRRGAPHPPFQRRGLVALAFDGRVGGATALAAGVFRQILVARKTPVGRADAFAALPARFGSEFGVLRKASLLPRNALSALSRYGALLFGIHGGEAAFGFFRYVTHRLS